MAFRYSWVLFFLVLQVMLLLIWKLKEKRSRALFEYASASVLKTLELNLDNNRIRWRNRIIMIGLFFLAIAAAGPQIGTRVRPVERKGVDLVIALDTSTSMDAVDVKPSRLAKSKFELGQLIRKLKGDRVSIIVFAGTSHLYLPLTTDYEAALLFLNEIDTKIIPTQGTAISSAIQTAMTAFTEEKDKYKIMLLVTDGEDHEGRAIELAQQAARNGLAIHTVGVGSEVGSLILVKSENDDRMVYKRDRDGKLITSTIDEKILRDIARAGHGKFFWFDNNRDTHLDIAEAIDSMEKKTISTHEFSEYEDRYQSVAFFALVLLIAGFVIPTRPKNRKV